MAKILIADDALFMRMTLGDILKSANYEVCEAKNGAEMLVVYEREQPDLVMLDITMPEMDGLTALRELKKKYPIMPPLTLKFSGFLRFLESVVYPSYHPGSRPLMFGLMEIVFTSPCWN